MLFSYLVPFCITWLWLGLSQAQAVADTPFTINGYLDGLSVNTPTKFNSGGFIDVDGYHIRVPDNLLVNFPAAFVPWSNLFATGAPKAFLGQGRYQVNVFGNIVGTEPRAGIIEFSQVLGGVAQGYIASIDYIGGSMKIANGPTIRINDPNGKYGKAFTDIPEFTADDENPSISAFSGFPMCIPRVEPPAIDPLCPTANRPAAAANPALAPDATVMAPFRVGDYLEFSGVKLPNGEIACYSIVANVDIRTTSGSKPSYIRMEDALIGVIDADPNVEFAQSKFIGFSSDPDAFVTISAIDVDPCTGVETDRQIASASTGGVAANPRARFRYLSDRLAIGKYTREYHITLNSGTFVTKNNITAGQYRQPVTEWVFPELLAIGGTPPPVDFKDLSFLADGYGPDDNGNVIHQLSPWPGSTAPTPSKTCPDTAPPPGSPPPATPSTPTSPGAPALTPVVSTSPDVSARPGVKVTLTARNTNPNIPDTDVSFSWAAGAGDPTVGTLTGANTNTLSFALPTNNGILVRTFLVTVTHVPSGTTATATVKVSSDSAAVDLITVDKFNWISGGGGTLTVTGHSNVVDGTATNPKLHVTTAGVASVLNMVAGANGVFTFSARNSKQPSSLFITDDLRGQSATITTLFGKRATISSSKFRL
ncbi:hypothetical protein H2201_008643 [Coniosporium apollinis]|uniref:Uncharacterized protein n=1 Tax=Coniosporium apollinis TaxID=61459 RepID=A0ABQ9NG33_9PEZI|nr:hypothetical protein H2201_008643 [Coniosporium apollinis]